MTVIRRVLIVSSYFPPFGSAGGSIRLVKFIKHISEKGWRFVVITQDARSDLPVEQKLSHFLLDELPSDIVVKRIAASNSKRSELPAEDDMARPDKVFGDSSIPWGLKAFLEGILQLLHSKVDLVFGVTPPFTNGLTAWLLSWVGGKPLVLDFKDDWVGSPTFIMKSRWRQKIEKILEVLFVRRASAVITVTPQSYRLYKERYAYLDAPRKFHLIPNGCDLEEYYFLRKRGREKTSERFLILSAAWGYRRDYRDIAPFLRGLALFFKKRPDAKKWTDVTLLGDSLAAEYDELISNLDLNGTIKTLRSVKRTELVEWLWKSDLSLLIQPVGNTTAISGTLYEYWATGRAPILLISEIGASSELVEYNHLGRSFRFEQVDEIAVYIENVYYNFERGTPSWVERDGVHKYDRKILAGNMEEIWRSIVEQQNPSI